MQSSVPIPVYFDSYKPLNQTSGSGELVSGHFDDYYGPSRSLMGVLIMVFVPGVCKWCIMYSNIDRFHFTASIPISAPRCSEIQFNFILHTPSSTATAPATRGTTSQSSRAHRSWLVYCIGTLGKPLTKVSTFCETSSQALSTGVGVPKPADQTIEQAPRQIHLY
jgi:hypothetical protein